MTGGYLYHARLARLAPDHGATIEFVSFPEAPWPLPALAGRRLLARARRSDVVVLDSIAAAVAAPWLLGRSAPPVVAMLHQPPGGIDHGPLRRVLQARLDVSAYRRVRCLAVASRPLVDDLVAAGFPAERIVLIPPGRDVAPSTRPPRDDLRRGRRAALLCVGNWVERKGILLLLEAVGRLPEDLATLHLVGDRQEHTPYGRQVGERVSRPDLRERVVVHGPLATEEVAGMYAAADVFVLPSEREPYGTVLGEAMASGLPVVGVEAGNLPYLATDGREGSIVPPRDTAALSDALRRLCLDEAARARMGRAAARRAETLPTWEQTAARFFDLLRACAAR